MAGVVHAGSQFRWYEQLCRIQVSKLRDIAAEAGLCIAVWNDTAKRRCLCLLVDGSQFTALRHRVG